jgi:hypothetical protein
LFLAAAGPWVVAAIGGVVTSSHDDSWLVVAAPSPFFAYTMVGHYNHPGTDETPIIQAGLVCAMLWGLFGLVFLVLAGRRCARAVREQNAIFAQTESALQAEDEARAAASSARGPST